MNILDYIFLENTVQSWLIALAIFGITVLILQLSKRRLEKKLVALIKKSRTKLDDYFLPLLRKTKFFSILTVGIYLASLSLTFPGVYSDWIDKIIKLIFFIQVGFWGTGLTDNFVAHQVSEKMEDDKADDATTIDALGLIARIVIWSIISLMVLDNLGVEVNSLLASLGIGGIAIALALQNILGDLFASLTIALDKPFIIGDYIAVGDYAGTVEDIGLKSTRMRSLSGEEIILSNTDLLSSRIRNYRFIEERRASFVIGVTYGTSTETLARIPSIIKEIVLSVDKVRFLRTFLTDLGDYSLNYEVVYFVQSTDYTLFMEVRQEINLAIYDRFEKEGIEFAFPTQTVFLEK